ncbi:phospholipid-transporting ATPase [Thraustotheca clavata]|uniref:Phospholipid-transporting ATPase n=1 Tax=Thraustotheca clavata TaxID=74557 RepID=A0A1V9ZD20_9STRA|nr:phospholipid-transporting ATPase [Thraustotheca clavata]
MDTDPSAMEEPLLLCGEVDEEPFVSSFRSFEFAAGVRLPNTLGSNRVTTSKYTMFNFIPKFLGQTFMKMTNIYFLFICILEMTPGISTSGGIPTTALPLLVVIAVDAFFQIIEDYARHQDDKKANNRTTERVVYSENGIALETIAWQEVRVGDILRIANNTMAAADMILLRVDYGEDEAPRHFSYVETSNLDGETNLKIREALADTHAMPIAALKGFIKCDPPNAAVNSFSGQLHLQNFDSSIPIQATNVILRGCTLRNTPSVYGTVFATGHDTKVFQCARSCPNKCSFVERHVNRELWCMVTLLLVCCLAAASVSASFDSIELPAAWYMHMRNNPNTFLLFCQSFLRFFLMLSNVVPISLVVTLNMVKSLQAKLMERDKHLVYDGISLKVKTMALNEDLGQISHIVTDKTGTLTRNVMVFRSCSVNGVLYGENASKPRSKWMAFSDINFQPKHNDAINNFLLHLALSHSVLATKPANLTELVASASSPDEQALLAMAYEYGYRFLGRAPGKAIVQVPGIGPVEFEILHILEFTSTRKRMSVILRNPLRNNAIELLIKGADSVLMPRITCSLIESTNAHLQKMAQNGLRTLVIASKTILEEEYQHWDSAYRAAIRDVYHAQAKAMHLPNEIDRLMDEIEDKLQIVGATGIEDGLQENVPSSIEKLRLAGIKIWMLTGDHVDTALNVARACNLLKNTTAQMSLVNIPSPTECFNQLRDLQLQMQSRTKYSLVVDGDSLYHIVNHRATHEAFASIVRRCEVVLACRTSPIQKAQVVELIQSQLKGSPGRVLAIGDGANDVAMIQCAHVGVGISGHEGLQAANVSDYAISQFSFLARLLFVHGRLNYQRTTFLVRYVFYKNIILVMSEFWYCLVSGVSGQKFYNEFAVDCFNTLYTALPIILYAIMDKDLPSWMCESVPSLYSVGIVNGLFRRRMIWSWILSAVFESLVICMVAVLTMRSCDSLGKPYGMWESGALVFTQIVLVVNYKLALHQSSWKPIQAIVLTLSVLCWFISAFIISASPDISTAWYDIFPIVMTSNFYWFASVLIPVVALSMDFVHRAFSTSFSPSNIQLLQEALQDMDNKEKLRHRMWQLPEKQPAPISGYAAASDEFTAKTEARRSVLEIALPSQ